MRLKVTPFRRLVSLIYTHANDGLCQREAERMRRSVIEQRDSRGIADLTINTLHQLQTEAMVGAEAEVIGLVMPCF